jgi:hypothetical protein
MHTTPKPEEKVGEVSADIEPLPQGCGYTGKHFGAAYEDAQCFGGILYDMDNSDSEGNLYEPLDQTPCPKCCHAAWLATFEDSTIGEGYEAASCGGTKVNPYDQSERKLLYEEDRSQLSAWWSQGWDEFHAENKGQPK